MADRLSALQRDVLRAVANLTDALGWPPTYGELADAVGISRSTVHAHLVNLETAGYVRRQPKSPRAVAVIERPS